MSHEQIKAKIAQLIRTETPWHPLNDQTITDLLKKMASLLIAER